LTDSFVSPVLKGRLAQLPKVTAKGAAQYGVPVEQFANWRWQMKHQIASDNEATNTVGQLGDEPGAFAALAEKFHAGITPYYAALMGDDPHCPIRLQGLPSLSELSDELGLQDPLQEAGHSPVPEVVQVYPDRVAFCVAQLCPVYCRYCFRKRRDESDGLHFNRSIVERGIRYIAATPAIRDVLITGGDPFVASDQQIINLVEQLRQIPHVEIIRFGTRTPVTLPYRITRELAQKLAEFHPIYVNTHFNCAEEITAEAASAIDHLLAAGIPVGNQSVLLRGVNDTPERLLALCQGLLRIRVKPYYLFYPHLVAGTEHLRVPVEVGVELIRSLRGRITGMGIPLFIVDTPSGKIPILPNHVLQVDGGDLLLQDLRGDIWREPKPLPRKTESQSCIRN
jgi:lysine 2,3-aminomutase